MKKRALVTGAMGFVGSHWVDKLIREGYKVTGVDISEKMLAKAQHVEAENIKYIHIDKFDDLSQKIGEKFDIVIAAFTTCEIHDKKELEHFFQQAYGVLNPGGQFIILNVNWEVAHGKKFISYKLESYPNLQSETEVSVHLLGDEVITIKDMFWSNEKYTELFVTYGFKHVEIIEPIAEDNM